MEQESPRRLTIRLFYVTRSREIVASSARAVFRIMRLPVFTMSEANGQVPGAADLVAARSTLTGEHLAAFVGD